MEMASYPTPVTSGLQHALLIITSMLSSLAGQAKEGDSKSVSKLVDEWVSKSATSTNSDSLLSSIRSQPPAKIFEPLRRALANAPTRSATIDLIGKIQHPRMPELFKETVRSEDHCLRTATLLLEFGTEDAERVLSDTWAKEPVGSPVFTLLTAQLSRHRLYGKNISFFTDRALATDAKALDAKKIAVGSLRIPLSCSEEELREARQKHIDDAKERALIRDTPINGTPIPIRQGLKWDANREIDTENWPHFPVPGWSSTNNHKLVLQFYPLEDDNCEVGYASTGGMWSIKMRDGLGIIITGSREEYTTPARSIQWNHFAIEVSIHDIPGTKSKSRTVRLFVNDQLIDYHGSFNGDIQGIVIHGHSIIGGCYIERT